MKKDSQNKKIYQWMKSGRSINPIQALNLFGCFRLGARCYDIEQIYNVEIKREMQYHGDKKFMKYWL